MQTGVVDFDGSDFSSKYVHELSAHSNILLLLPQEWRTEIDCVISVKKLSVLKIVLAAEVQSTPPVLGDKS
jgi:hypothetical protein